MDIETFAKSTLQLLQQDPRRYRNFGVYWYLVKAVLKKFYTQDNLGMLGEYVDPDCLARMPSHDSIQEALDAAVEEYGQNARYNIGRINVDDLAGGGRFTLHDEDAGF